MHQLIRLAIALAAFAIAVPAHAADTWPAKPIRVIVPAPAGVAPDIIARILADKLSAPLGQRLVVENRPGAGGIPGMSAFVRSPADGYTLALVPASTVTLTPYTFKEPQFDVDRDLVPVAGLGASPMMIAVSAKSSVRNLQDLIAQAKAKPGQMAFASPLANSVPHLTAYMLDRAAGIELYPVVYNGSIASVTATVTGESAMTIDGLPPLVPQVKAGELRAIAVTSRQRLPGYEDVPAVAETYPGFESIGWFAVFAPTGTSREIVTRLNREINAVIKMPDVVARLADLGVYPDPGPPEALAAFLAAQRKQWKDVVDMVGLKAQ